MVIAATRAEGSAGNGAVLRGRGAGQLGWIAGAAMLGLGLSGVFSGLLHLSRDVFLFPYLLGAAGFLEAYRRQARVDVRKVLRARRAAGLAGAVVVGAFVVWSVLRQPPSPRPEALGLHLLWLGVAYGLADGLLLSVLPVAATWRAMSVPGQTVPRGGWFGAGILALAASLIVTAAYHLGYTEFQNASLKGPLIGCGVMSVAYILTRNPLSPLLSHIAMHVAAVLHGLDSTVQLPPHG